MRNAINNLQAIFNAERVVDSQAVYDICDIPNLEILENLFDRIVSGNHQETFALFKQLWDENYCIHDLLKYLQKSLEQFPMKLELRLKLLTIMSNLKILEGRNQVSRLQIVGAFCEMLEVCSE